jgi:hypothetical protein
MNWFYYHLRRATAEGIWVAVCKNPDVVVLDIEGADGQEHQVSTTAFLFGYTKRM